MKIQLVIALVNLGIVWVQANPPCLSGVLTFSDNRVVPSYAYTGDYTNIDFTMDGQYAIKGTTMLLKMSKPGQGSTMYSTRYINYGSITARIKTSRTGGVVSSFIMQADDKDEIDFEWVGSNLNSVQTNWYYRGIFPTWPDTHGAYHSMDDTYATSHAYTIDWTAERIQWSVNGNVLRTLTNNGTNYPSSPSRVAFGIWDGGSGAEGTREWAGGYVNFDSADIQTQGFFDVQIESISINCY